MQSKFACCRGLLRVLKKVSAITRRPLYRGLEFFNEKINTDKTLTMSQLTVMRCLLAEIDKEAIGLLQNAPWPEYVINVWWYSLKIIKTTHLFCSCSFLNYECVHLSDKMIPIHFPSPCKIRSILHHGSAQRVHKKKLHNALIYLFCNFLLFFIINFVFLSFPFLFRSRILTNQKHELMVPNCQWNCMYTIISVPLYWGKF